MLLDVRYFEQHLPERALKKGLKLFESGSLEFVGKQGDDYHFIAGSAATLAVRKTGHALITYTCSCKKEDYCEHLAAALFFFQQEALGLSVKKKAAKKKEKKPGKATLKTAFEARECELRELLKPYLELKVLGETQLDDLYEEFLHKKNTIKAAQSYAFHLATVVVLPLVFEVRTTSEDTRLRTLMDEAYAALRQRFEASLNKDNQEQWYQATMASVRNNVTLKSDAFLFLIPRLLTFLTDRQEISKLRATLESRKYKISYANRFDKLLIARLEVAVKAYRFFKSDYPTDYNPSAIELIVAKAELDFCSGRADEAFNRLALNYENVRLHHLFYYSAYLDYILEKARAENKPHIELKYLKKSLIHNVHILPRHLDRLMAMVPEAELDQVINEVIAWLRSKPVPYLFDKVADLMLNTGRLDELIDEIRKHNNKFNLLHKVLVKKLPYYDYDTLDLYMEHLLEALNEAGFYHFQQHVYNKAKTYLDELPESTSRTFIDNLLMRLGRVKQISRYINGAVNLPA